MDRDYPWSTWKLIPCNETRVLSKRQVYGDVADTNFATTQWETSLQSNTVFRWLDANLESAWALYLEGIAAVSFWWHLLNVSWLKWSIG